MKQPSIQPGKTTTLWARSNCDSSLTGCCLPTSKCKLQIIQTHFMNLFPNPRLHLNPKICLRTCHHLLHFSSVIRQRVLLNWRFNNKIERARCRRWKCLEVQPLARLNSGSIRLITLRYSGWGIKVTVCWASRSRSCKEGVMIGIEGCCCIGN